MTSSNGCEEAKEGQRTYWVATDVRYNEKENVAFVECDKVDIKDAISRVDMVWGKYKNKPSPTADKQRKGEIIYPPMTGC